MKKIFLIIAIALVSATSSFAYTADVRNGNSGNFTVNARSLSYMLETDGGNSVIMARDNNSGVFYEAISSPSYSVNLVTGYLTLPNSREYFTTVYLETFGGGTTRSFQVAQASW